MAKTNMVMCRDCTTSPFNPVFHVDVKDCPKNARGPVEDTSVAAPVATAHVVGGYKIPDKMLAVWRAAMLMNPAPNLMFVGPPGSGKTEGANALASLDGLDFTKWDCASMTDPNSWFGQREIVVEDGVAVTFYRPSLFVERIQTKGVILLDEINRIDDGMRQVLLPLLDKSRAVLNPLNGQIVKRHPECVIVMSGNVGLRYTGTSAIDPAFTTRSAKLSVDYVDPDTELAILTERTGVSEAVAKSLVRFAVDVREKAKSDPDWPTVSTRELIEVSQFVVNGLDASTALEICVFNGASDEGGTASVRSSMNILWAAIGGN